MMEAGNHAVFGAYRRHDEVEEAVGALIIKGFPSEMISTLIPERMGVRGRGPEPVLLRDNPDHTVGEDVSRGTLGLLDHLGAIAIPDLGLFIGAGPLMSTLVETESAAASARLATVLEEMGAPAPDAKWYERVLRRRALVTVKCADPEWASRAKQVLKKTGAERLSSTFDGPPTPKARHGGATPL